MTTATKWYAWLEKLKPCEEAMEWAQAQKSAAAAWRDCEDGSWMLWLAGKFSGKSGSAARRRLVLASCACARLSLRHVPKGEHRPRKAIETAEAWARQEKGVTLDHVRDAADAAADAADAAAADAADAATYAAYAARVAARAAACAAAYAAAYAAAHAATLQQCADIVREYYPRVPRRRDGN